MKKTLIFVDTDTDISDFNTPQSELSKSTVFSFNVHTHKLLEEKGIQHEIGESYLNEEDHYKIFDKTTSLSKGITAQPIKLNTNVIIGAIKKRYLSEP